MSQRPEVFAGQAITVDVPTALREREFPIVLVSLTRSHTHRAVSYGEGPQALIHALTRAQSELMLFGDMGTLGRRAEWTSGVDHLDESAAALERDIVTNLERYLHGQGTFAAHFQIRPGVGFERVSTVEGRPPRAESRV
jgi:hypothetical protein